MKKKKCFQMNVTDPEGRKVSLRLPKIYQAYFDKALMDTDNNEYDNSIDALVRFFNDYFSLEEADRELLQDIICCGLVSPCSLVDLIILMSVLDEYYTIKDVRNPADLCEFYVYLAKKFEPESLTAKLTEDMYDEIGREIVEKECGKFFRGNYYGLLKKKLKVR